jgi:hypothetical protein
MEKSWAPASAGETENWIARRCAGGTTKQLRISPSPSHSRRRVPSSPSVSPAKAGAQLHFRLTREGGAQLRLRLTREGECPAPLPVSLAKASAQLPFRLTREGGCPVPTPSHPRRRVSSSASSHPRRRVSSSASSHSRRRVPSSASSHSRRRVTSSPSVSLLNAGVHFRLRLTREGGCMGITRRRIAPRRSNGLWIPAFAGMTHLEPPARLVMRHLHISSNRSRQLGFIDSISLSFHLRSQCLSCFSRVIAAYIEACTS